MIEFTKMQGIGNDFVVVDEHLCAVRDPAQDAQLLCRRRFGVGADGLLIVGRTDKAGVLTYRMFNPDGSEDMCGNGLRCALLWAYRQGLVAIGSDITVRCFDRARICRILDASPDGRHGNISVEMGRADFTPENIPFTGSLAHASDSRAELTIAGRKVAMTPVSTGSAHAVVFLESEISDGDFELLSPLIENHPDFPERTSIMWTVPVTQDKYRVRIWERAVGETLGCGTGATAIAAVAWSQNRSAADSSITVRSRGGELSFRQTSNHEITLTGPAEGLFSGRIG
jgi:diaminopimelate epimerase